MANQAVSTLGCLLYYSASTPFASVSDLSSGTPLYSLSEFPEFGAAPEDIDTTVLYGEWMTHMPGKKDVGQLEFVGNLGKYRDPEATTGAYVDEFAALCALDSTDIIHWAAAFEDGSFVAFDGYPSVRVNAAAVNDRAQYTLTITYAGAFNIVNAVASGS